MKIATTKKVIKTFNSTFSTNAISAMTIINFNIIVHIQNGKKAFEHKQISETSRFN
jgi:hypothetical protein